MTVQGPDWGNEPAERLEFLREAGREWGRTADAPQIRVLPDMELYGDSEDTGRPIPRIGRSQDSPLEMGEAGWLTATRRRTPPRTRIGALLTKVRRTLIGSPIESSRKSHETLTKIKALAVLSSDAISSVAYGPEQILVVLILAGAAAASAMLIPVAIAILTVLTAVTISYRQTIRAYPNGGGSYIVAKDNLGVLPGLTAGASLMTDYVLTVAVSISAGIAAVTSALPGLTGATVILGIFAIAILAVGNLRGIREAGSIFALPTYLFIFSMALVIGGGLIRYLTGGAPAPAAPAPHAVEGLTLFVILRAFASGSSSLTGVEAISDGVIAFKPVQWRNARVTLTAMALILGAMLAGTALLAHVFGLLPRADETLLSQLGRLVFGTGPLYFFLQATTTLILLLAANTAFSDFPRLLYFLARDGYAPRQFSHLGDRLSYSNGIIVLGLLSGVVYAVFRGQTDALIPLYAIGVFASFTLSQLGMVSRWRRRREATFDATDGGSTRTGWRTGLVINAFGAIMTAGVLVITISTKFTEGAWSIVLIIPMLVALALAIRRHYDLSERRSIADLPLIPSQINPTAVVPIKDLDPITLQTLALARRATERVVAVHIADDRGTADALLEKWSEWGNHIPLQVIESPYRNIIRPLMEYLDAVSAQTGGSTLMVFLPELVYTHWWEHLLHNQTALRLKVALLFRPKTVVVNVPYHLA